ncbi:MAG: hypothetical protein Solumvirus1_12 [Solumvirus sp.]|uniref:Uncharacterized protein n=1 Tax=Solumvirus sp. TaxID=2487773 RepID=A0A3G5AG44_9VIRU|nr:MAG: hypothetical protein Solumvirus1_12 [Solumvirus sp.]
MSIQFKPDVKSEASKVESEGSKPDVKSEASKIDTKYDIPKPNVNPEPKKVMEFLNGKQVVNIDPKRFSYSDLINDPLLNSCAYMPMKFRQLIRQTLQEMVEFVGDRYVAGSSLIKIPDPSRKQFISERYKSSNLWVELEHRFLDSYSETTRAYSQIDYALVEQVFRELKFSDGEAVKLLQAWKTRYPLKSTTTKKSASK